MSTAENLAEGRPTGISETFEWLRLKAQNIASLDCGCDLDIEPVESSARYYCEYLTAILLYSREISIQIKVHYMLGDARLHAALKMKKPASQLETEQTIDYFREHCNVIAGHLQTALKGVGITVGHSLPFAIEGYNEVFFYKNSESIFLDTFVVKSDNYRLIYSTEVIINSKPLFEKLEELSEKSPAVPATGFELL